MGNLVTRLLGLCQHVWKEYDSQQIILSSTKAPIGMASYCACEKCGQRKIFKMTVR